VNRRNFNLFVYFYLFVKQLNIFE